MISAKKKIAIVGMNESGHRHFSELRRSDYFELVGIYDKDCKEDFGRIDLYHDLDKLFDEKKPEAVVICATQYKHKNLILKIINHARNLLIEAPFAINLEESREIKYAARNSEANIAIFYKNRFNPTVMSLLREFAKGEKIYTMNFINGQIGENGFEIENNTLLKELDLARILSASEIGDFESQTTIDKKSKKVVALSGLGRSKNDILLTFICSNLYAVPKHNIHISTSGGVYLADLLNLTLHKFTQNGNINLKVDNENFCCRHAHKEFFEFCDGGMLKRLASIDESIKIREILQ